MYDQFYGFAGRPFQLTPDPHFYFESSTHRKAMSYLGYGLAQGEGFIVITGDIGAGKTTLVGHLMATVDPARLTAVKIVSTQVEGDDMVRLAAQAFGISTEDAAKALLLQKIEAWLHAQARSGRRTLLIVDEAQNLSISALEELRMLSNFQLGGQALLQIFLLGQPEFRDMLAKAPELEQLRQRVIATHHLDAMLPHETKPYVEHRLKLVGWNDNPRFTDDAYATLHQASGGIPRRLNALASRVLLLGAIDRLAVIDAAVVDAVIADMAKEGMSDGQAAGAPAPVEATPPTNVRAATEAAVPDDLPVADVADEQAFVAEAAPVEPVAQVERPAKVEQPTVEPPPTASVEPLALAEMEALRAEVAELRGALAALAAEPAAPHPDVESKIARIEQRVGAVEARLDEQDAALRRVLGLLIDWVERDDHLAERLRA